MKTFKFTCKQNQVEDVCFILSQFGKPHIKIVNGFPVITVDHNTSNSKINKMLFMFNIPGATQKKNLKVVKCDRWELPYSNIQENEWFIWVWEGKMRKVQYSYQQTCECCGPMLIIHQKKNGKVFQI